VFVVEKPQQQKSTSSGSAATPVQQKQMSHPEQMRMQMDANLIGRQMDIVCSSMRRGCGRRYMFETNFIDFRTRMNSLFDDLYEILHFPLRNSDVPACFVKDVSALLHRLEELHQRKIKCLHMGGDFGQEFLKVDFTIEWQQPIDDDQSDHGRRRVIIIANLPKVHETYDAIRRIFKQLNISDGILHQHHHPSHHKCCLIQLSILRERSAEACMLTNSNAADYELQTILLNMLLISQIQMIPRSTAFTVVALSLQLTLSYAMVTHQ